MARELEERVVQLVRNLYGGELQETPPWLVRPGRVECGQSWPLVQEIYSALTGMQLPEVMRRVERRTVDAVLKRPSEPPRILEVDEKQHFNAFRGQTLQLYASELPLAYPKSAWLDACAAKKRLEGGGFGEPKPPLFPGDGGRHLQRAFRDALSDIVPIEQGWLPTLRFADFEVKGWIYGDDAEVRLGELLGQRLEPVIEHVSSRG